MIETDTNAVDAHRSVNGTNGGGDFLNARGGDFDGMVMTIDYADGTTETVTWSAVDGETGEAVGSGVAATATGSTHFGGFQLDATDRVAKITLETLPAAKVFFDVTRAFNGQPGDTAGTFSGGPLIFVSGDPLSGLIKTAYSGVIGFGDAPFGADAFTTVELDFTGLDGGGFLGSTEFGIDLDRLAVEGDLAPVDVPEPVVTDPATDALYDTFTVTADDGTTGEVQIAISGVNDVASFASGLTEGAITENTSGSITSAGAGRFRTVDVDSLESAVQVQEGIVGTYGLFSITETGVWTYELDEDGAIDGLAAGATATDVFTVLSADGTASDTVTITVTAANDAPVGVDDTAATTFDAAATGNVLANDTDREDDALTASLLTDGSFGAATVDANGDFTYTPNAGFVGTDSFVYTVEDSASGTDTATVTVTVTDPGAPS